MDRSPNYQGLRALVTKQKFYLHNSSTKLRAEDKIVQCEVILMMDFIDFI